jgi:hypothetical protein
MSETMTLPQGLPDKETANVKPSLFDRLGSMRKNLEGGIAGNFMNAINGLRGESKDNITPGETAKRSLVLKAFDFLRSVKSRFIQKNIIFG